MKCETELTLRRGGSRKGPLPIGLDPFVLDFVPPLKGFIWVHMGSSLSKGN